MARALVIVGMLGMLSVAATAYADHAGPDPETDPTTCLLTAHGDVALCEQGRP